MTTFGPHMFLLKGLPKKHQHNAVVNGPPVKFFHLWLVDFIRL